MKVSVKENTEPVHAEIVKNVKELVKTEKGTLQLEAILKRDFTPDKIKKYILDLCEAEDIKMTKDGDEYRSPNWEARKNGLDRVLSLLRYSKNGEPVQGNSSPVKMIFNIVNSMPKEKK